MDQNTEEYRSLFDLSPVGYVILNRDGLILKGNPVFGHLIGVQPGMAISQPLGAYVIESDQSALNAFIESLFESCGAQVCHVTLRQCQSPNDCRVVQLTGALTVNGSECCIAISDVTELQQAISAAREHERKLATVLDLLPVGLSVLDGNRTLKYQNPRCIRSSTYLKKRFFKARTKNAPT